MRIITKWTALLLILALSMSAVSFAAAEGSALENAVANGREVNVSAKLQWHSPSGMFDEQTNSLIASIVNALEFKARTLHSGSTGYADINLMAKGESALSFQVVTDEEGTFVVSSLLPEAVAVNNGDEAAALAKNLEAWFINSGIIPPEMQSLISGSAEQSLEALTQQMPFDPEALLESLTKVDTTALENALSAWAETALVGESSEGQVQSQIVGVETKDATIYQITKQELGDLMHALNPLYLDFDPFWTEIFKIAESQGSIGDMTLESFLETVHSAAGSFDPSTIPDDVIIYYAECHDATGAVSTNIVHLIVPVEGEDATEFYIEWLPNLDGFFFLLNSDEDGFTLGLRSTEETTEPAAGQTNKKSTFNAVFTPFSGNENSGQVVVNVETTTEKGEAFANSNTQILAGVIMDEQEMGVVIQASSQETRDAATGDVKIQSKADINFHNGAEKTPLLTATLDVSTGDPQGPPFDTKTSDILFFHPGAVDEQSFAEWMNTNVSSSLMIALMNVVSKFEAELFPAAPGAQNP